MTLDIIKGYDPQDPTSIILPQHEGKTNQYTRSRMRPLRIGVPVECNTAELHPLVRRTWITILKHLQREGHLVRPVRLPSTKAALSAYYVIAPAEASSNLARFDGVRYGRPVAEARPENGRLYSKTRGSLIGDEARRRILLGSYSLSAAAFENYFIKAQVIRRLIQHDFNRVFSRSHPLRDFRQGGIDSNEKFDVLITPTVQSLPPKLKDLAKEEATAAYSSDVLTVPSSLAGLPAINVPVPYRSVGENDSDIPTVGMQIIAQYGDDELVFAAARAIEDVVEGC